MIRALQLAYWRLCLRLTNAEIADCDRDVQFAHAMHDTAGAAYIVETWFEPAVRRKAEILRRIAALHPSTTAKGLAT